MMDPEQKARELCDSISYLLRTPRIVTCVNCKFEWQMDARNAILVPEEKPEMPSAYDPGA